MSTTSLARKTLLKADWGKKVTPSYLSKVRGCNQIQYDLSLAEDGVVELQAINIWNHDKKSLEPERVPAQHLSLLKVFVAKKWLLAETFEMAQSLLKPNSFSLFCAYILYFNSLMNHFIAERDDILDIWLFVESTTGGYHHHPERSFDIADDFDVDLAIQHSISIWEIADLYEQNGNIRRISRNQLNEMRLQMLNWFQQAVDDDDSPSPPRKKARISESMSPRKRRKREDSEDVNSEEGSSHAVREGEGEDQGKETSVEKRKAIGKGKERAQMKRKREAV